MNKDFEDTINELKSMVLSDGLVVYENDPDWEECINPPSYDNAALIYDLMTGQRTVGYVNLISHEVTDIVKNETDSGSWFAYQVEKYSNIYETICDIINYRNSIQIIPATFSEYGHSLTKAIITTFYPLTFTQQSEDNYTEQIQKCKEYYGSMLSCISFADKQLKKRLNLEESSEELPCIKELRESLNNALKIIYDKAIQYGTYFYVYHKTSINIANSKL